jgi:hypothetical protein
MALTLMYLRTNNEAVAARLALPDTRYFIDHVRSDIMQLLTLGRALVMWDTIEPEVEWVLGQVRCTPLRFWFVMPRRSLPCWFVMPRRSLPC